MVGNVRPVGYFVRDSFATANACRTLGVLVSCEKCRRQEAPPQSFGFLASLALVSRLAGLATIAAATDALRYVIE